MFVCLGDAVFWCSFLSGCVAGSCAALCVNPFDVIKTRLQAISEIESGPRYNGIIDAVLYVLYFHNKLLSKIIVIKHIC